MWSRPPALARRARTRRGAPGARRTSRRRSRRRCAAGPGGRAGRRPRLRWPDLRVAHLAGRQPDGAPRRPARRACGQRASRPRQVGIGAAAIGVGGRVAADPEPVEDDEDDRPRPASGRCRRSRRRRRGRAAVRPARATIPAISSGLSEAPPTSAPSIDGLGEELADVRGRDAAAVEDGHVIRGAPHAERARASRGSPSAIAAASAPRRVAARPDRPDRLVGDRPGRPPRGRAASWPARQPRSCASTTSTARPASRSASCSPTHRIGRRPASTARPSLRPISSSVSPASRRRSEWPTMTHVARPVEHRRRDLARVRAGQLVVDVLGADGDVRVRLAPARRAPPRGRRTAGRGRG